MLWWISGVVVLFALIVVVAVMVAVAGTLRQFGNTALALERRLVDGQARRTPWAVTRVSSAATGP